MLLSFKDVIKELDKKANKEKAKILSKFFKTGKGEYGEGDVFLGITVPEQRKIAHKFSTIFLPEIKKLLNSKIHEHRFTALEIIVIQYTKEKDRKKKEKIKNFYLNNLKRVNNWDLVDTSAPYILGDFLVDEKDRSILYKLVTSKNLWQRRMAIVSTYAFIRQDDFKDTIKITEKLIKDKEDLIRKACGWMMREVGKKEKKILIEFLDKYHKNMPRVMLRYSIEKLSDKEREKYMRK